MKKPTVKMWDTSSVEAMERTAKLQADGMCCVKIIHVYLEVTWDGKAFQYKWGKNYVGRKEAVNVLATREAR